MMTIIKDFCHTCGKLHDVDGPCLTNTPLTPVGEAKRDPLLIEREKTHGSFAKNAEIYCKLQTIFIENNQSMNDEQRCALSMIAVKIARALSNPKTKDTWLDIAGYAKLGAEACE